MPNTNQKFTIVTGNRDGEPEIIQPSYKVKPIQERLSIIKEDYEGDDKARRCFNNFMSDNMDVWNAYREDYLELNNPVPEEHRAKYVETVMDALLIASVEGIEIEFTKDITCLVDASGLYACNDDQEVVAIFEFGSPKFELVIDVSGSVYFEVEAEDEAAAIDKVQEQTKDWKQEDYLRQIKTFDTESPSIL